MEKDQVSDGAGVRLIVAAVVITAICIIIIVASTFWPIPQKIDFGE